MFDMVIVLLDGTHHAEAAIPFGIDQAELHDAPLGLLRVIPRPEPVVGGYREHGGPAGNDPAAGDDEAASEHAAAVTSLEALVSRFRLDANTELLVGIGDPFLRLHDRLRRYRRPLLVMSTGGRGRAALHQLDDAARRLLEAGHVDILLVHTPVERPGGSQWLAPPGTGELGEAEAT